MLSRRITASLSRGIWKDRNQNPVMAGTIQYGRIIFNPTNKRLPLQRSTSRSFHYTPCAAMVKPGDRLPNINLLEGNPGNTVDLSKEITGNGIIIGVPAAFSPTCSDSHIPGFIKHPMLKSAGKVFVVSVNDPFVTKAWGKTLDPDGSTGIRFLADTTGKFSTALDVTFDAKLILGNIRSKRYVLTIEDGNVKEVFIEPDNTGLTVTAADKILG